MRPHPAPARPRASRRRGRLRPRSAQSQTPNSVDSSGAVISPSCRSSSVRIVVVVLGAILAVASPRFVYDHQVSGTPLAWVFDVVIVLATVTAPGHDADDGAGCYGQNGAAATICWARTSTRCCEIRRDVPGWEDVIKEEVVLGEFEKLRSADPSRVVARSQSGHHDSRSAAPRRWPRRRTK